MTEYHWHEIRERAARSIDYPDSRTEANLLDVFERNPAAVSRVIEKILSRVQAGKLGAHAGWLIIAREVEAITRAVPDVTATDEHEHERERKLDRARQWMRNAGCFFPTEAEIEDELFNTRGLLRDFRDDATRQEMVRLFHELRPLSEQVEREELERAEKFKQQRASLRAGAAARVDAEAGTAA